MDIRAIEDLLLCLFDPQLAVEEKINQLQLHCTKSARSFDEMGLPTLAHGMEIEFVDGSRFQILICDMEAH